MSAPAPACTSQLSQEEAAERASAAEVLLSHSLLLLHAQAAGVTVPAMRLQLLRVRGARAARLARPARGRGLPARAGAAVPCQP
jgi:hypothetical protein